MCFSNLPIEFDDDGNPYLAEEADDVDRLPASDCGCADDPDDVTLEEADPEAMVNEILESMPASVRERLADGTEERDAAVEPDGPRRRESADEQDDLRRHESAEGD